MFAFLYYMLPALPAGQETETQPVPQAALGAVTTTPPGDPLVDTDSGMTGGLLSWFQRESPAQRAERARARVIQQPQSVAKKAPPSCAVKSGEDGRRVKLKKNSADCKSVTPSEKAKEMQSQDKPWYGVKGIFFWCSGSLGLMQ